VSNRVDHIQHSRISKPNRGPSILPAVLASVVDFNPPGVVKNKLGILERNALLIQASCHFIGVPFKLYWVLLPFLFAATSMLTKRLAHEAKIVR
jgi:hypothetical protein